MLLFKFKSQGKNWPFNEMKKKREIWNAMCKFLKVIVTSQDHRLVIMFTPPALRSILALVADSDVSGRV